MPKTLSEVLASMRVENAAALFTSLRAQYAAAIRRAHLISRDRVRVQQSHLGSRVAKVSS